MKPPLRVGLTGGIGSGKSTVKNLFDALGAPTVDADDIAHAVTCPGEPAFEEVVARFGPDCIDASGALRRAYLRELIFGAPELKAELEAIIHPRVYAAIRQFTQSVRRSYCIICIPLLLETRAQAEVDRILVVDAPEALRIKRVAQRDKVTRQQVRKIINAQVGRQQRLQAADQLIVNNGAMAELEAEVKRLHRLYLAT